MSLLTDIIIKNWPVFPAVFVAGVVDAIAGGGGLISLPTYMLAGLPPHLAIGTNKMSSFMGTSIATFRFAREGYINLRLAVFAVVFALAGSYTGANISLLISNRVFKILMLFILPLAGLCNVVGNWIGVSFFDKKGGAVVKPVMLLVLAVFLVRTVLELIGG